MFIELEKALEDQDFRTAMEDVEVQYMDTIMDTEAISEMLESEQPAT